MGRKSKAITMSDIKKGIQNQIYEFYNKYPNHINKLKDLDTKLKEMGLLYLNDEDILWVYLQSFKDDDILKDKYIYNFGLMDDMMKKHIGEVIDYRSYLQTIIEMEFSNFKEFYEVQKLERELLYVKYPGLIMDYTIKG